MAIPWRSRRARLASSPFATTPKPTATALMLFDGEGLVHEVRIRGSWAKDCAIRLVDGDKTCLLGTLFLWPPDALVPEVTVIKLPEPVSLGCRLFVDDVEIKADLLQQ